MDFIVALLPTIEDLNALLTIIDKFSKRVLLILGKTIYIVSN